jgi:dTDP-4-dehydrorhamnose 3,5-epimerase
MSFTPLSISGAFVFEPVKFADSRGHFQENFKLSTFAKQLGIDFIVKQVNQSVSSKGVIRGIHFADNPPGQAKYINCPKGIVWDVVVDLRQKSPTFGKWEGVELSELNGKSVFIAEGIGHAFLSLEEDSVVNYLCSEEYNPITERQINPLDQDLAIDFLAAGEAFGITEFILSNRDDLAPALYQAQQMNILPL